MKKIDWSKVAKELDEQIENNEAVNDLSMLDELMNLTNKNKRYDSLLTYYNDIMQYMCSITTKALIEERYEICAKTKIIMQQESDYIIKTINLMLSGKSDEEIDLKNDILGDVKLIENSTKKTITKLINTINK